MILVDIAVEELLPTNIHNEFVNIGQVADGSYYCSWVNGSQRAAGYFTEDELELQNS